MVHSGRRVELHVYIATLFLTLMIASAVTNITMQYLQTRQMMLSASTTVFGHIDPETRSAIARRYDGAIFAADLLAETGLAQASTLFDRLKTLPVLVQALCDQPSLSALLPEGGAPWSARLAWLTSLQDRNLNAVEIEWPFRLGF